MFPHEQSFIIATMKVSPLNVLPYMVVGTSFVHLAVTEEVTI